MAYFTHCCCGCMTVKTGTKVLAILSLIGSIIGLVMFSAIAANYEKVLKLYEPYPEQHEVMKSCYGLFVAYAVMAVIGIVVAALCLQGTNSDNRYFLLPYLVYDGILLVIQTIIIILGLVGAITSGVHEMLGMVCSLFISLAIQVYFFMVVLSYYKQLTFAERSGGAIGMVPAASTAPPGTYVAPPGYAPQAPAPQYYPPQDSKMGVV